MLKRNVNTVLLFPSRQGRGVASRYLAGMRESSQVACVRAIASNMKLDVCLDSRLRGNDEV